MRTFHLLILFLSTQLWAHEPNEAYFSIIQQDGILEVQAELPWTIRNALLNFDSKLEGEKDKSAFEASFFNYIKANLILKDHSDQQMDLIKYEPMQSEGHSHQNNMLIHFRGEHLKSISNTILFNIYHNQKNIHQLKTENGWDTFTTLPSQPIHLLDPPSRSSKIWIISLSLLITSIFGIIGYRQVKNSHNTNL